MRKISKKVKRGIRVRKKLKLVNRIKPRVSVFKSLKNFSAQIIDDQSMKTVVSVSSIEKEFKNTKNKRSEMSSLLAEKLAMRAKEKNIGEVYFDRGKYKFHGIIKNFAETLRKNGIKF